VSAPARVSVITIGARDLPALREFYAALGFPVAIELDDFVAFETRGAVFTLYQAESLAADARAEVAPPQPDRIATNFAINVDERDEVDAAVESARAAGARIAKEPTDMEWGGRSAYFTDPEGNWWEIAWVPPDTKMAGLVRRASGEG
jgi:catechol 2,3-dioxygenase-like lactoylglutathione lyase family enzyme